MAGAATFGKRGAKAPTPVRVAARTASLAAEDMPIALPEPAAAASSLSSVETGLPLATVMILLILLIVFAFEVKFSPQHLAGMTIPGGASVAYGAASGNLVFHDGGWWRLFTAPLLHGSFMHLFSNALVFGIIGYMLEPQIGSRWFSALFAIGAIGGSIGSLIFSAPATFTVGASGAIMGVLSGAFICGAFTGEDGPRMRAPLLLGLFIPHIWIARIFGRALGSGQNGWRMQTWAIILMIPALIPMTMTSHTDYGAHLGGVVTGALCGIVMQANWRSGQRNPDHGNIVGGFAIGWLLIGLLSFALFAQKGDAVDLTPPGMIPDALMPPTLDVGHDRAADLLSKYPNDPRAHLIRAIAFLKQEDLADAEDQLRISLTLKSKLNPEAVEIFEKEVNAFLSITLSYEGKPDQAKAIGAPVCDFAENSLGHDFYELMQKREICPAS